MLSIAPGHYALPGNRWDLLDDVSPDDPPSVSIVVPYFEQQRQLDLVLTALTLQTHPHARIEVFVVDDGSAEPPTVTAAGGLSVEVLRQDDLGFRAGAARNLGAAHANGEVLCFLDSDTIPEPDYVGQLSRLPALAPEAIVTGRRRHADLSDWTPDRLEAWFSGRTGPVELEEPEWLIAAHRQTDNLLRIEGGSYRYVISAVLACSRSFFDELGGFDESLVGYGGEDWELAHRALCAGALLAHVPTAIAWHDGPSWALRGSLETRRAEKNAETAALMSRIPLPRKGIWTARPYIAVTLQTAGEEATAIIIGVNHLLAAEINCGIWLVGPHVAQLKQAHFRSECRVMTGPGTRSELASTRLLVQLSRPLMITPDGWNFILAQDSIGEVTIDTEDGRLTATVNGARSRADRWAAQRPGHDLIQEFCGSINRIGADVGVSPVPRHPDLNRELAALQRR